VSLDGHMVARGSLRGIDGATVGALGAHRLRISNVRTSSLLSALCLAGCGSLLAWGLVRSSSAANAAVNTLDPSDPALASVRKIGESAIDRSALRLLAEVSGALTKSGAPGAVEHCRIRAEDATNPPDQSREPRLKRTSRRLRNAANVPDAAEEQALALVEQMLAKSGKVPPVLIQEVATIGGGFAWRVSKPILIRPMCLACHGDPAQQDAELRAVLAARYPDDAATGYKVGDWRGLFSATVTPAHLSSSSQP
jgi:hypothetical protein